jgi:Ala-tRNA(Pro) deacylase
MPAKRLKQYLDTHNIKYVSISHSLAFTALEIAKSAHIPSKEMAKTIIVNIDGQPAMVVLPAAYKMDLKILSEVFDTAVTLADEPEFSRLFPDCEVGAMPPFGNLYDLDVYIAESVTERETIAFNAGSHSEVIKMTYKDFEQLVKPKLILLA